MRSKHAADRRHDKVLGVWIAVASRNCTAVQSVIFILFQFTCMTVTVIVPNHSVTHKDLWGITV